MPIVSLNVAKAVLFRHFVQKRSRNLLWNAFRQNKKFKSIGGIHFAMVCCLEVSDRLVLTNNSEQTFVDDPTIDGLFWKISAQIKLLVIISYIIIT